MKKKAIIHIGMHKTGTTTIQALLSSNREKLLESGIHYPSAGTISTGGHLNLVYETISSWNFRPNLGSWVDLVEEVRKQDAPVVMLSAENFSGAQKSRELIESIKHFCAEIDAEPLIVGYLRPQYSYINSLYAQNAATGYTSRTFSAYVFESLGSGKLDFEHIFGPWMEAFKDTRVFSYESVGDSSFINQFLKRVGLEGVEINEEGTGRFNARLGVRAVEYARKATEVLHNSKKITKPQRHSVAKYLSSGCSEKFPNDKRFSGLDLNIAQSIEGYFAESNKAFFNGRLNVDDIFTAHVSDVKFRKNVLSLDTAPPVEINRFLSLFAEAVIHVAG